jgi:hypothetical protein
MHSNSTMQRSSSRARLWQRTTDVAASLCHVQAKDSSNPCPPHVRWLALLMPGQPSRSPLPQSTPP